MCDFISWIPTPEGVLYLTDKEIFSKRFKDLGIDKTDAVGHGAIEAYYELTYYEHKEVRDFWNTEKLPPEIAEKLKTPELFLQNWGKCLNSGVFQNNDLIYIIEHAPDEYKKLACDRLLQQNPSNDDLRYMIYYTPDKCKKLACDKLLQQNPSNNDLICIIECAPDEYKKLAWDKLLQQNPSNTDLRYIVKYASDEYKELARKLLK